MDEWTFSLTPPPGWSSLCDRDSLLFGSPDWLAVLEAGFGSRILYAWNGRGGAAISIFRAGPFAVGYFGFPAGTIVGDDISRSDILSSLSKLSMRNKPVCVRAQVSAFPVCENLSLPFVASPETAITNLQSWSIKQISQKTRRIRKAEREGLRVEQTADSTLGAVLYRLYENTVKGHGGSLRYSNKYFEALVKLSAKTPALQVRTAVLGSQIAGFLVTGHHGKTTYYLHGGTDAEYRNLSPSDLLMADAIAGAQSAGSRCFNFMASPPGQPSLVRYKEKWGGETRQQKTYTASLSASYPLFRAAESIYRLIS